MSDIVSFTPYYVDSLGNEDCLYEFPFDLKNFDPITGEVSIKDYSYVLDGYMDYMKNYKYKDVEGYEGYFVLQFNIEKYRDITVEREDISSEEALRVATMQSSHQSILEYLYQFTIAQDTQQRLNEIAYTIFITVVSTLLSMGITYGLNKMLFSGFDEMLSLGTKVATETTKATEKVSLFQRIVSKIGTGSFNGIKVVHAAISETFEELYVDPWIEAYVTNSLKDQGASTLDQIFWSCFWESARESFISGPVDIMRHGFQFHAQQQSLENLQLESINQDQSAQNIIEAKQGLSERTIEGIQIGISILLMFTGTLTGSMFGSVGTTIGSIMIMTGTSLDNIYDLKRTIKDILKVRH